MSTSIIITSIICSSVCVIAFILSTYLYLVYRSELKREEKIRSEVAKQQEQLFGGLGASGMQLIPLTLDSITNAVAKPKKSSKDPLSIPEIKTDKPKKDIN